MKRILSMFLAILCVFSPCTVNGYKIENLKDGNKKIIIKYNDLEGISVDYNKILNEKIIPREKIYHKLADVTAFTGSMLMVFGVFATYASLQVKKNNEKNWWKGLLIGAGSIVLGFISLFKCNKFYMDRDSIDPSRNPELALKKEIDLFNFKKTFYESNKDNFYYNLYVNKKGYIYKTEQYDDLAPDCCDCCNYERIYPKLMYKFPLDLNSKNK